MKSIYNQDDLSLNNEGSTVQVEARACIQKLLDDHPEYNPREIVELCIGEFTIAASRRILDLRRIGVLMGW